MIYDEEEAAAWRQWLAETPEAEKAAAYASWYGDAS